MDFFEDDDSDYATEAPLPTPGETPYRTPNTLSRKTSRDPSPSAMPLPPPSPPRLTRKLSHSQHRISMSHHEHMDDSMSAFDPRRFTPTLHANLVAEILSLRRDLESKSNFIDQLESELASARHENESAANSVSTALKEAREVKRQLARAESDDVVIEVMRERDEAVETLEEVKKQLDRVTKSRRMAEEDLIRIKHIQERDSERFDEAKRGLERRAHVAEGRLKAVLDELAAREAAMSPTSPTRYTESEFGGTESEGFSPRRCSTAMSSIRGRPTSLMMGDNEAFRLGLSLHTERSPGGLSLAEELEGEESDEELGEGDDLGVLDETMEDASFRTALSPDDDFREAVEEQEEPPPAGREGTSTPGDMVTDAESLADEDELPDMSSTEIAVQVIPEFDPSERIGEIEALIEEKAAELQRTYNALHEKTNELDSVYGELERTNERIVDLEDQVRALAAAARQKEQEVSQKEAKHAQDVKVFEARAREVELRWLSLEEKDKAHESAAVVEARAKTLMAAADQKEREVMEKETKHAQDMKVFEARTREVERRWMSLEERDKELAEKNGSLDERCKTLEALGKTLTERSKILEAKEAALSEKTRLLDEREAALKAAERPAVVPVEDAYAYGERVEYEANARRKRAAGVTSPVHRPVSPTYVSVEAQTFMPLSPPHTPLLASDPRDERLLLKTEMQTSSTQTDPEKPLPRVEMQASSMQTDAEKPSRGPEMQTTSVQTDVEKPEPKPEMLASSSQTDEARPEMLTSSVQTDEEKPAPRVEMLASSVQTDVEPRAEMQTSSSQTDVEEPQPKASMRTSFVQTDGEPRAQMQVSSVQTDIEPRVQMQVSSVQTDGEPESRPAMQASSVQTELESQPRAEMKVFSVQTCEEPKPEMQPSSMQTEPEELLPRAEMKAFLVQTDEEPKPEMQPSSMQTEPEEPQPKPKMQTSATQTDPVRPRPPRIISVPAIMVSSPPATPALPPPPRPAMKDAAVQTKSAHNRTTSMQTEEINVAERLRKIAPHLLPSALDTGRKPEPKSAASPPVRNGSARRTSTRSTSPIAVPRSPPRSVPALESPRAGEDADIEKTPRRKQSSKKLPYHLDPSYNSSGEEGDDVSVNENEFCTPLSPPQPRKQRNVPSLKLSMPVAIEDARRSISGKAPDMRKNAMVTSGVRAHARTPSVSSSNQTESKGPPIPVPPRKSSKHPGYTSDYTGSPTSDSSRFPTGTALIRQPSVRKVRSAAALSGRSSRRMGSPPSLSPASLAPDSPEYNSTPPMPKDYIMSPGYERPRYGPSRHSRNNLSTNTSATGNASVASSTQQTSVVDAISQTMIGEWMWKYVRRRRSFSAAVSPGGPGAGGVDDGTSGERHQRWVWLAPYERMVMWSSRQPTSGPALLGKSGRKRKRSLLHPFGGTSTVSDVMDNVLTKQVTIQSVLDVKDDGPPPKSAAPGQAIFNRSILILTPARALKFTAPNRDRHYVWLTALSFLAHSAQENAGTLALPPPMPFEYDQIQRQNRSRSPAHRPALPSAPLSAPIPAKKGAFSNTRDSVRLAKGRTRTSVRPQGSNNSSMRTDSIREDHRFDGGASPALPPSIPRFPGGRANKARSQAHPAYPGQERTFAGLISGGSSAHSGGSIGGVGMASRSSTMSRGNGAGWEAGPTMGTVRMEAFVRRDPPTPSSKYETSPRPILTKYEFDEEDERPSNYRIRRDRSLSRQEKLWAVRGEIYGVGGIGIGGPGSVTGTVTGSATETGSGAPTPRSTDAASRSSRVSSEPIEDEEYWRANDPFRGF